MATLSPSHRSCIKFSSAESCVNRVVFHLSILKDQLQEINRLLDASKNNQEPEFLVKVDGFSKVGTKNAVRSSSPRLVIEGVTTGIPIENLTVKKTAKQEKFDRNEVVGGAVILVARLEQDRQETLSSMTKERERVFCLSKGLDKECARRLNLLPSVVQAEHDELLRDLMELRWHVKFNRRQLDRVKNDLKLRRLKNSELKHSVDYYVENCPLLEEKLVIESLRTSAIARDQQSTLDQLNQAKHSLSQTEDRSNRVHKRVNRERNDIENTLDEARTVLITSEAKLKDAIIEASSITHRINNCCAKVSSNQKDMESLDGKMVTTMGFQSQVESRVALFHESFSSMESAHLDLERKLEKLHQKKQSEHGTLNAEYVLLMANMQKRNHKLREARESKEDLQHSNDTLKENIALFNKQTQVDEKSIERASRELVKLDEQMGVSVAQFTKVREEHVYLSDQLKTDEAKAGNIEHSLRTKLEALKQQIKGEGRTRSMYDGKVQASSAELDKMKAEFKQQADKAERLEIQSQKQSYEQTDIVNKLEKKRDSQLFQDESLKSQLRIMQTEHIAVEKDLTENISLLSQQELDLSGKIQSKVSRVENISKRIKVLRRKLEDTIKSTAMLDKMETSTNAVIDKLQSQLLHLRERLAAEKEEEQYCKEEYKEISNFSSDTDEKHSKYLEKRSELLKQCRVNLFKAHACNTLLAEEYRRLQYDFISVKTLALQVVEKKLVMEESLRDHKQLQAFQSCIYASMKVYYEHRGSQGWKDVTYFHEKSKHNARQ
ncbi:coiled-coil domain-containing protein 178-like isoform X2 [Halichondria panicea]|uniref:coiled-coil domain-containing protein 178-like isoform X2 n=1 Tax=Halichondria panicea TaxID=6063 RepID=UPI00312B91F7